MKFLTLIILFSYSIEIQAQYLENLKIPISKFWKYTGESKWLNVRLDSITEFSRKDSTHQDWRHKSSKYFKYLNNLLNGHEYYTDLGLGWMLYDSSNVFYENGMIDKIIQISYPPTKDDYFPAEFIYNYNNGLMVHESNDGTNGTTSWFSGSAYINYNEKNLITSVTTYKNRSGISTYLNIKENRYYQYNSLDQKSIVSRNIEMTYNNIYGEEQKKTDSIEIAYQYEYSFLKSEIWKLNSQNLILKNYSYSDRSKRKTIRTFFWEDNKWEFDETTTEFYDDQKLLTKVTSNSNEIIYHYSEINSTSIEENETKIFEIFPNPNYGNIYIRSNIYSNSVGYLKLFDLTGKLICEHKVSLIEPISINVSSGLYIYNISLNGFLSSGLIVIDK